MPSRPSLRCEQFDETPRRSFAQRLCERIFEGASIAAFGRPHASGAAGRDASAPIRARPARRVRSAALRLARPCAYGFASAQLAREQHHLPRQRLADRAGQPLGAAGARHQAELDLRLPQARVVGDDQQIAAHRELKPPPSARPRTAAIERNADVPEPVPSARSGPRRRELGDIAAGGERARVAGDDHGRACAPSAVERVERIAERAHERVRERVEPLRRTIEPQQRDPLARTFDQRSSLIGSGVPAVDRRASPCRPRRARS